MNPELLTDEEICKACGCTNWLRYGCLETQKFCSNHDQAKVAAQAQMKADARALLVGMMEYDDYGNHYRIFSEEEYEALKKVAEG